MPPKDATVYRPSGHTQPLSEPRGGKYERSLLQSFVGGYEHVHDLGNGLSIVVNRDGQKLQLPANGTAMTAAFAYGFNGRLYGNVIILPSSTI